MYISIYMYGISTLIISFIPVPPLLSASTLKPTRHVRQTATNPQSFHQELESSRVAISHSGDCSNLSITLPDDTLPQAPAAPSSPHSKP